MTAVRTLLARINARLDDIEAGPAVIGVAVFIAASLAALIFGSQVVLNLVLIAAGVVLFWNFGLLHSRADEALDRSDKALSSASDAHLTSALADGRVQAIHNQLTGNEQPGSGRHSKGRAA